jgi:5'-nucleotidase (lipoprotein e(P4) family)
VKATLIFAFAGLLGMGCATPQRTPFSTALDWVTRSREYKAVCLQTYASALEKVAAAAQKESGPWAIVMDLDETVLDNSGYQRDLETKGEAYSQESWEVWVLKKEAALVPGAKEFISKVRALPRARIIFISNRYARNTNPTRLNLEKLGVAGANDIYMLRKEKADTKIIRQKEVLEGTGRMVKHGAHRVVAWFGDAAHDMPDDAKLKWGTHKFMLPNPVYGNWDE